MNAVRWVAAALLVALGCWCLLWLTLFVAFAVFAKGGPAVADDLILGAWVPVSFTAAYFIQPWRPNTWRERHQRP